MTIYSMLLFSVVQTGADGCICHMEYVKLKDQKVLEFIGMKQVKELTSVQSLFYDQNSSLDLTSNLYATGFASTDFIVWNLITEAKVHSLSLCTHCNYYSFWISNNMDRSRYYKFNVVDGGVLILIILVTYQNLRNVLHMSRFFHASPFHFCHLFFLLILITSIGSLTFLVFNSG